jgi:ribose transport system ATP-binding protein
VLALTGENGAGKSTLSKIICGLEQATTGTMLLDGKPYQPASRGAAEALGIRMVMQELNLIPTLSIAENLYLENLPQRFGFIDRARLSATRASRWRKSAWAAWTRGPSCAGHRPPADGRDRAQPDRRLPFADARRADGHADAPRSGTAVPADRAPEGGWREHHLYSHRLEELKRVADRIAVLRDGQLVCDDDIAGHSAADLVSLMVGRSADDAVDLSGRTIGAPLLRVRGLARGKVVNPTSFDLRAGEILGIAGLIGSGRTELLRLIFGADRADAGAVFLGDSEVPAALHSPQAAVQAGIAMITEDRKGQGLLLRQSIAVNTTLASLDTVSHAGWAGSTTRPKRRWPTTTSSAWASARATARKRWPSCLAATSKRW